MDEQRNVYINKRAFTDELHVSATPDTIMQQAYDIAPAMTRPGVYEVRESGYLGVGSPVFELHENVLTGALEMHPPGTYSGLSGGYSRGPVDGNRSYGVWGALGLVWAIASWVALTWHRTASEPVPIIVGLWVLWGAVLFVIERGYWNGSTEKHNGFPIGVVALLGQAGAYYLFIRGHASFDDDSSPVRSSVPFALAAVMPVSHAVLCLVRSKVAKREFSWGASRSHNRVGVGQVIVGLLVLAGVAYAASFVVSHAGDRAKTLQRTTEQSPTPSSPTTTPALVVWSGSSASSRPELRIGDSGEAVSYLQTVLRDKAGQTQLIVDGQFGPGTETAVKAFQTFVGIAPADGVVRSTTWAMIDSLNGE